ncbi:MAG TPA: TIM barrel protein, partial [Gaiellaceae bacterium]
MKTSLGIWAMGPMVTRFVPAGYQPEHQGETTATRVRRAVEGLGDLIDDYEFHYPQELSDENLEEVRAALGDHGIYCVATGLHLDPRFGRGGLVSPDAEVREEARRRTRAAADFAGRVGAHFIV